jgi:NADH dehydrogenase
LETLGVQIWTNSLVSQVNESGVQSGEEHVDAATVLWAAGVEASALGRQTGAEVDRSGRVIVEPDLSIKGHANVFVAGDMAACKNEAGRPLPGTAPVALQQGQYLGNLILKDLRGAPRKPFHFVDKGQMATIGRSRAIVEIGKFHLAGRMAWMIWLAVHIYYLTGFRNRLFVVMQWAWSYLTFRRGARLIVDKEWRFHEASEPSQKSS